MPVCEGIEVYFPEVASPGSISPKQFDKLRDSHNQLSQKVSRIEGHLNAPVPEKKTAHPIIVGLICLGAGALLSFWGWMALSLVGHGNQLSEIATTQKGQITQLKNISASLLDQDRRLTTIETLRRLESAAQTPASEQSQVAARSALAEARQKSIPVPVRTVENAGRHFIEASNRDPKAWDVVLDFLSYRSSFNVNIRPRGELESIPDPRAVNLYWYFVPSGKPEPRLSSNLKRVPIGQAARIYHLDRTLRTNVATGPEWLFLKGGAISLDGTLIKHVVFEDVEVHYSGGAVVAENAIFINCTFVVTNTAPGRRFGERVLASSSVTFRG